MRGVRRAGSDSAFERPLGPGKRTPGFLCHMRVATADQPAVRQSASIVAKNLLRRPPSAQTEHLSLTLGSAVGENIAPTLLMTVPKRLLARAVDRNLFKRLARECWRFGPLSRHSCWALVRLRRCPSAYTEWTVRERKLRWRVELSSLLERGAASVQRRRQDQRAGVHPS